ncbi:MAG: hypothetical protein AMXMBFR67_07410 [Nitrospira sp.]
MLDNDKSGNVDPLDPAESNELLGPVAPPVDPIEPMALGGGPPDFAIPRSDDWASPPD